MLDCQLFGVNPGPPHVVNALLHAVNVCLLFLLLNKATGALWRSLLAASLFAFHPLNVESVAWLIERKTLLSFFFSLLTLAAYGWYISRPNAKRYAVVMGAFLLALMSKPMVVSLPLLLLLLDYWPLKRVDGLTNWRQWVKLALEKLPLMSLSVGCSILTYIGQQTTGAVESRLPIYMRLENAAISYVTYLGKIFWPARLSAFYPHPAMLSGVTHLPWPDVFAALVILAGISIVVLRFNRVRYLLSGWFLFLVALVPMIGIVQVGAAGMADRFTYLPAIGIFVAVVWACGDLVESKHIPKVIPAVVAVVVIVALAILSAQYLRYWENGIKLFSHIEAVNGAEDKVCEGGIGTELLQEGRLDDALVHFQKSCALDPSYDGCHFNIGLIMYARSDYGAASTQFMLAAQNASNDTIEAASLVGWGKALLAQGDFENAEKVLATAIQIDPNDTVALQLLDKARMWRVNAGHGN
jgi:tetratricopeptide (TPR) repeat protein